MSVVRGVIVFTFVKLQFHPSHIMICSRATRKLGESKANLGGKYFETTVLFKEELNLF